MRNIDYENREARKAQDRAAEYFQTEEEKINGKYYFDDENKPSDFKIISAGELMTRKVNYDWLINGLFEKHSIGQIFGATGSGKSFIALDMAVCVGAGIPYYGRETQKSKVVYICGEGLMGLTRRLHALKMKYKIDFSEDVFISLQPGAFINSVNVAEIAMAITEIGGVSLVFIDTYHRNLGGGDENSANDFATVLKNIDDHLKPLGITIILIHHVGHLSTDRSRGSSSIRAAMDFEYQTQKDNDSITLTATKMKDGELSQPLGFQFKSVVLGADDNGWEITSGYLEADIISSAELNKPKISPRNVLILNSLSEATAHHGVIPTSDIIDKFAGVDKGSRVVRISDWRKFAFKIISVDSDNEDKKQSLKRVAFHRARTDLQAKGLIGIYDDYAWRIY
jgi:hypothetical protein